MAFSKVFKELMTYITEDQLELDLYKCMMIRDLTEDQRIRAETKVIQIQEQIKRNRMLMLLLVKENEPIHKFRD